MQPAHASMLFQSERMMDIAVWDSILKTMNAQEAMHWKICSMCGQDPSFLEGMYALWVVANYYQHLIDVVSHKDIVCTKTTKTNHNRSSCQYCQICPSSTI